MQTEVGPEGKGVMAPWYAAVSFYYLPLAENKPEKAQLSLHNWITEMQTLCHSLQPALCVQAASEQQGARLGPQVWT